MFEGHSNNITCIAFNIEGKWIVSGGEDGTIKIWDLRYAYVSSSDCVVINDKIPKLTLSLLETRQRLLECMKTHVEVASSAAAK